jgi:hypothetical protein
MIDDPDADGSIRAKRGSSANMKDDDRFDGCGKDT